MAIERIMVQLDDHRWTLEVTHTASQIARSNNAEIVFVKLVPVQHIGWLGTELGYRAFTGRDYADLREYASVAEDYGVTDHVQAFQYVTFVEGIVQAAEFFDTDLVFAIPLHPQSLLGRLQRRYLKRSLANHHRLLADAGIISSLQWFPDQDFGLPTPEVAENSNSLSA